MTYKPNSLKDEFTDKYYEENNSHDKVLFNPSKAVLKPMMNKTGTHSDLNKSHECVSRNQMSKLDIS